MAIHDYSADSAHFIPSSPMVLVRSDVTGSGRDAEPSWEIASSGNTVFSTLSIG
jgi:hypothetical protein